MGSDWGARLLMVIVWLADGFAGLVLGLSACSGLDIWLAVLGFFFFAFVLLWAYGLRSMGFLFSSSFVGLACGLWFLPLLAIEKYLRDGI